MESTSQSCDHVLHTNQKENKNSHSEPKNKIRIKYKKYRTHILNNENKIKNMSQNTYILFNGKEYKKYRSKIKKIQKENKKYGKQM